MAALKASQCVVAIATHFALDSDAEDDEVFVGSGTIIECQVSGDGRYASTILATASLFDPEEVEVDVYLSDGKLYEGKLIACDFHYNLAAVRIQSDFPLQPAKLMGVDDVFPIPRSSEEKGFQLRPHSSLFKLHPEMKIIYLTRSITNPHNIRAASGRFCSENYFSTLDCNDLYWMKGIPTSKDVDDGGAVINCNGDVIGIMRPFLPINIVSRWWAHFKLHG